uniref:Bestrophin homolog n=1 Tax=Heterorhabditis bacteriophora TaxID=37862 RepID=A0A1I7XJA5_HETBA
MFRRSEFFVISLLFAYSKGFDEESIKNIVNNLKIDDIYENMNLTMRTFWPIIVFYSLSVITPIGGVPYHDTQVDAV